MSRRFIALPIAFVIALSFAPGAVAQTSTGTTTALDAQTAQMDSLAATRGQETVIGRTADTFATFAGSRENAVSLATGLRNSSEISLTGASGSDSTTFTPTTRPMGHGNVFNSLALAQQRLASEGITEPTPQQIEAALNGGTITVGEGADAKTVELQGVLQMRADGMGWGQIAQAQGTKLGPVVSALRSANASVAKQPRLATTTSAAGAGITTAAGDRAAASKYSSGGARDGGSRGNAASAQSSRGIQNAMGGASGPGHGHAYGKTTGAGIVTATGARAGSAGAGSGIVNAGSGQGAAAAAGAASHGRGAGVVSAGGGQGQGHAYGRAK